ncbi:MAG: hypothetical protein MRY74_12115 [Neomegalonema sp.]|nr:hypothetical protein [Neomegalonema sp.]
MKTAFIIHAPADRAAATEISEALDDAGVRTATRPVRGDRYEIEALAARMKSSDVAVPLLSHAAAASREFRRDLHLALLYDRPLIAGRLDDANAPDALAADADVLMGTAYADKGEALSEKLQSASYIGITPEHEISAPLSARVRPLVERVRKEIAVAASSLRDTEEDALGFPKSPEAMLARWRLIEPSGSIEDFHSFHEDYQDDPYFGPLAAEMLGALERKRFLRGVGGVLRWSIGTAAAAALVAGGLHLCADGGCALTPADSASRTLAVASLTAAGDDRTKIERAISRMQTTNSDLTSALKKAKAQTTKLSKALEAAEKKAARAEAEADEARKVAETALSEAGIAAEKIKVTARRLADAETAHRKESARADKLELAAVSLVDEIDKLKADKAKRADATTSGSIEAKRLREETKALRAAIAKSETDLAAALKRAEKAEAEAKRVSDKALDAAKKVAAAEARAKAAEAKLATAEAQAKRTAAKLATAQARLAEAEKRAGDAAARLTPDGRAAEMVAAAERRATEARLAADEAQTRADDAEKKAASAQRAFTEARAKIGALEAELAKRPAATSVASTARSRTGAVRLLQRVEAHLSREDTRRRRLGVRKRRRGPTLDGAQLRRLQACMRDKAGAKGAVDGLWGVKTTRAILALTPEQAERVADCLSS